MPKPAGADDDHDPDAPPRPQTVQRPGRAGACPGARPGARAGTGAAPPRPYGMVRRPGPGLAGARVSSGLTAAAVRSLSRPNAGTHAPDTVARARRSADLTRNAQPHEPVRDQAPARTPPRRRGCSRRSSPWASSWASSVRCRQPASAVANAPVDTVDALVDAPRLRRPAGTAPGPCSPSTGSSPPATAPTAGRNSLDDLRHGLRHGGRACGRSSTAAGPAHLLPAPRTTRPPVDQNDIGLVSLHGALVLAPELRAPLYAAACSPSRRTRGVGTPTSRTSPATATGVIRAVGRRVLGPPQ